MILSYSLDVIHVPLHILFILFYAFIFKFYELGLCCVDPICVIFSVSLSLFGINSVPESGPSTQEEQIINNKI
jgi:hypothetical protein